MRQEPAPPVVVAGPPRTGPTGIVQIVHLEAMEHAWEIAPGTIVRGYAYNAQVPGPTLEATVGDTLLVRFTNSLPEPTGLDWHGLRPARSGAAAHVCEAVPPCRTVEHRLELSDAGTFWYHPHVDPAQQTDGLYGALVVRDPAEPVFDGERVLVIGHLKPARLTAEVARTPEPWDTDRGAGELLLNGVSEAHMLMSAGHRERWRMVNAGIGPVRLSLSGQPLRVMRSGSGAGAEPVEVDEVLLTPGERRDLVGGPFAAGATLTLNALPHNHSPAGSHQRRVATVHVTDPGAIGSSSV